MSQDTGSQESPEVSDSDLLRLGALYGGLVALYGAVLIGYHIGDEINPTPLPPLPNSESEGEPTIGGVFGGLIGAAVWSALVLPFIHRLLPQHDNK